MAGKKSKAEAHAGMEQVGVFACNGMRLERLLQHVR